MDLLKALSAAAGAGGLEKLGGQFGLDSSSMQKVLQQVVPAMGSGLKKGTSASGGLDSLLGALQKGGHESYLKNPQAAASQAGIQEGNGILGHIFGSKDVSRKVASQAAKTTGVSADLIKKMLPMVATMVMGTLSKQTSGGTKAPAATADQGGQKSLLRSLLDSDNDGSILDDVLGLAKKFF
jgi:hypothetical protein